MRVTVFDRQAAVDYARKWALGRNPRYYNFDGDGGDCTNFVSQCVYAGCGVMNRSAAGWYYVSPADRAPAWTSVKHFYKFVTENRGRGPFGRQIGVYEALPGDIVQLGWSADEFYHSLVVTRLQGGEPLLCAHTYDVYERPLSAWRAPVVRVIRIEGVRRG